MLDEAIGPCRAAIGAGGPSVQALDDIATLIEATLTRLLRARSAHADDRKQAIMRPLIKLLTSDSEFLVALAARVIERLRLFDREVARALIEAQTHENGKYGWHTVRALQAMAAADLADEVDDRAVAVDAAFARLTGAERAALREIKLHSLSAASIRVTRARGPGWLRRSHLLIRGQDQLLFRKTLLDSPELQERIAADMGWARAVACLYGGVPFADTERRRREIAHWQAVLASPATPPDRARHAAEVLDALAEGDRAARARPGLSLDSITVDSPLTSRLLRWLRGRLPSETVARLCLQVSRDHGESAAVRGDALLIWAAVGAEPPSRVRAELAGAVNADADLAGRVRWRLARAEFLLGDRLSTDSDDDGIAAVLAAAQATRPSATRPSMSRSRRTRSMRGRRCSAPGPPSACTGGCPRPSPAARSARPRCSTCCRSCCRQARMSSTRSPSSWTRSAGISSATPALAWSAGSAGCPRWPPRSRTGASGCWTRWRRCTRPTSRTRWTWLRAWDPTGR